MMLYARTLTALQTRLMHHVQRVHHRCVMKQARQCYREGAFGRVILLLTAADTHDSKTSRQQLCERSVMLAQCYAAEADWLG